MSIKTAPIRFAISAPQFNSGSTSWTCWAISATPRVFSRIPKGLPIYIIAGTGDIVGGKCNGLADLIAAYRVAGLPRVTYRVYPEGRCEVIDEMNRFEVRRELIVWLDEAIRCGDRPRPRSVMAVRPAPSGHEASRRPISLSELTINVTYRVDLTIVRGEPSLLERDPEGWAPLSENNHAQTER